VERKNGGFQYAFEEVMPGFCIIACYKDGEAEELLMRSKADENWRCSNWNSVILLFKCSNVSRGTSEDVII
jgi:hypothetical protein